MQIGATASGLATALGLHDTAARDVADATAALGNAAGAQQPPPPPRPDAPAVDPMPTGTADLAGAMVNLTIARGTYGANARMLAAHDEVARTVIDIRA